ncbi:hypothetical protein EDC04DRAFT_2601276 [Pisolithus marmoratus]|nr:hypothetical protein EDC04DRAFT_2601276 [Pisolithus marmoratus]
MFWDHDIKWCITVMGTIELDFCFSHIQTLVGCRAFNEGISKLKQVTGHDHHAVQHYIIATVARVASALQEFHDHKGAIIPKLKLLQSVIPSICQSGAVIQWSADITKYAHVKEIKVPAHACNNQNYYSQIVCHLDWLNKCFHSDLATHIQQHVNEAMDNDDDLDLDKGQRMKDKNWILRSTKPSTLKPYCTFTTPTTTFHLATKPSSWLTLNEAATAYQLSDLKGAIVTFFANEDTCLQGQEHDIDKLQVWHKVHVQQLPYHNKTLLPPQTLHAIPPSTTNLYGQYDSAIISLHPQSDWPQDLFLAYVQPFNIIPQSSPTNVNPVTGMHMLK